MDFTTNVSNNVTQGINNLIGYGNNIFINMYNLYLDFITADYYSKVLTVFNYVLPIFAAIFVTYLIYKAIQVYFGESFRNMAFETGVNIIWLIAVLMTIRTSPFIFDFINNIKNTIITLMSNGQAHNSGQMVQNFYSNILVVINSIRDVNANFAAEIALYLIAMAMSLYGMYVASIYFFKILSSELLIILLFIVSPVFIYLKIYRKTESYFNSFLQGIVSNILILAFNTLALLISITLMNKLFASLNLSQLKDITIGGVWDLLSIASFSLLLAKYIGEYASHLATQLSNSTLGSATQGILAGMTKDGATVATVKSGGKLGGLTAKGGYHLGKTGVKTGAKTGAKAIKTFLGRKGNGL